MAGDGVKTKPWYTSKTIWFNLFGTFLAVASTNPALIPVDPQIVAGVVSIGNILLRTVSGQPLTK